MSTPEENFFTELYSHYGYYRRGKVLNHMLTLCPIKNSKGEVDNRWYRLPSPGDGSCLFHSVVMNILSDEARIDIAKSIRLAIANSLTPIDYCEIQGGLLSIMNMHIILQNNLSLSSFNNPPKNISEKEFKNKIDEIITRNSSISSIIKFKNIFLDEVEKLGFNRLDIDNVFKECFIITFNNYISVLKEE